MMRISDEIRDYANLHQIDEWSVFELAYLQYFGTYNEYEINECYRKWFNRGTCSGPVEYWMTDFLRKTRPLQA